MRQDEAHSIYSAEETRARGYAVNFADTFHVRFDEKGIVEKTYEISH